MRPPPPIIPPCPCTDAGRTHEEKGLCSAIPPCCRRWFITAWTPLPRDDKFLAYRNRDKREWRRWEYVPCPGCRQCGARVEIRRCEEA